MKEKLIIAVFIATLFACNNASKNETSVKDSAAITKDTVTKLNADTSARKIVVAPVKRTVKKKTASTKPKSSDSKQKKKTVTRSSSKKTTNKSSGK